MLKDSFLDTNVIVHYAHYQKDKSIEIVEKSYLYIINKKGKFIICYATLNEIYNVLKKLAWIHKEVLEKVKDNNHKIEKNKILSPKDISSAEKLFSVYRTLDPKKLNEIFSSEREIIEIKIEQFLKYKLDEKVIPIENIRIELINKIREIIPNYSDCKILASAFQSQQEKDIFLLVTADAKDLDPNGYDYLKQHLESSKLIEKPLFPELVNLMFTN